MRARSGACTHIGRVRQSNQDRYGIDDPLGVYVLADGMGGYEGGDVAAQIAVAEVLREARKFLLLPSPSQAAVNALGIRPRSLGVQLAQSAHQAICKHARENPDVARMGSTIDVLLVGERSFGIAHVGDARVYLLRSGLHLLTQDHTLGEALRAAGQPVGKGATSALISCLGPAGDGPSIDVHMYEACADDVLLMCSDGVHRSLSDREIARCLMVARSSGPEAAATALVQHAVTKSGADNATAVIVILDT